MLPLCYRTVYLHVWSREAIRILQNSGTLYYVVYMQHPVAKPIIAS